jgi:hypothetical protein
MIHHGSEICSAHVSRPAFVGECRTDKKAQPGILPGTLLGILPGILPGRTSSQLGRTMVFWGCLRIQTAGLSTKLFTISRSFPLPQIRSNDLMRTVPTGGCRIGGPFLAFDRLKPVLQSAICPPFVPFHNLHPTFRIATPI